MPISNDHSKCFNIHRTRLKGVEILGNFKLYPFCIFKKHPYHDFMKNNLKYPYFHEICNTHSIQSAPEESPSAICAVPLNTNVWHKRCHILQGIGMLVPQIGRKGDWNFV